MKRLDGCKVLITGAAQGQGLAQARRCALEGAIVFMADEKWEKVSAAAGQLSREGFGAQAYHLDVSSEEAWRRVIDDIVNEHGTITTLVNNAGILITADVSEFDAKDLSRTLDVNLKGPFFGCKHVIPVMKKNGGGSIINISSTSGRIGSKGGFAMYAASKAGLLLLSKSVAMENVEDNIRSNSILPGPILTPMAHELSDPEVLSARLSWLPMNRIGTPDEVAGAVAFLASEDSSYMTGSEMVIDGGTMAT